MQFGLSESQEFLKDSARKFFAGECPSGEMRRLMETDTAYDAALWSNSPTRATPASFSPRPTAESASARSN